MKTCETCGGKLYRHGATYYSTGEKAGQRYQCSVCKETFTAPIAEDVVRKTPIPVDLWARKGRRMLNDWRMTP